nr:RNA-directed DNA polymerase, eukaryota, reverse transcriptase zinc-binding domain protein [Tanacetum cinerariifolium]
MNVLSINSCGAKQRRKHVWIKDLHNVHFLGIQECKMTKLDLFRLKSTWGNYSFDYACNMARGRPGGLISLWDPNMFVKKDIWCDDAFVIVKGKWKNLDDDYFMINIYDPRDSYAKATLWNCIDDLCDTIMVLFGYKVKQVGLVLLSDNVIEALPDAQVTALDRLYHSWFNRDGFDELISSDWNFLAKIVTTKAPYLTKSSKRIVNLAPSFSTRSIRLTDLHQKSRIKWDIEGDKNSKFFHGLVNQRRRTNSIHGIMSDGMWVTNPLQVKETFLNFFKEKFQPHDYMIDLPFTMFPSNLSSPDHDILKKDVTLEEIKSAVWDCGNDKALGPYGFTFSFIKRYWELLINDIMEFVTRFLETKKMPMGYNSSFITLIPKIGSLLIWIILFVFYLASGLKINIHKSNVYGVGVSENEVHSKANNIGCSSGSFPFIYLGLPIGANINLMEGGFGLNENSSNGIWSKIVGSSNYLHSNAILPSDSIRFRVGCSTSIRFWKDLWTGARHSPYLKDIFNEISLTEFSSERDVCYWSIANDGLTYLLAGLTFLRLGVFRVTVMWNYLTTSSSVEALLMIFGVMSTIGVTSRFLLVLCLITGRFGSILGMRLKKRNGVYLLFLPPPCGGFG